MMATDNLLRDPDWKPIWNQLQRNEYRGSVPALALFDFESDGSCTMRLKP